MLKTFAPQKAYKIAVVLSSFSMAFGILREFIIIGLLGFTAKNDGLQLYLSIFYTIGMSIDAMRLACLNLYSCFTTITYFICFFGRRFTFLNYDWFDDELLNWRIKSNHIMGDHHR